jgi:hypothetical protein
MNMDQQGFAILQRTGLLNPDENEQMTSIWRQATHSLVKLLQKKTIE